VRTPAGSAELIALLAGVARRLEDAYAVCVTAELALAAQNADRDAEIARSLRAGVSEVIAAELHRIGQAAVRLDVKGRKADSAAITPSADPGP
jgi:hypothetical protein